MDKNKTTPLHLAARYGHEDMARLLIESGAAVRKIDMNGRNALDIAIHRGNKYGWGKFSTLYKCACWYIYLSIHGRGGIEISRT